MLKIQVIAMTVMFAVLVFLVGLWIGHPPTNSTDNAAWAQAITSAAAVVVTFLVVLWQHQLQIVREQASRTSEHANRISTARELIGLVITVLRDLRTAAGEGSPPEKEHGHAYLVIVGVQSAFAGLRLDDFGPVAESKPLLIANALMRAAQQDLSTGSMSLRAMPGAFSRMLDKCIGEFEAQDVELGLLALSR
jgi:hypothetical protein